MNTSTKIAHCNSPRSLDLEYMELGLSRDNIELENIICQKCGKKILRNRNNTNYVDHQCANSLLKEHLDEIL